ncbi:MAG: AAA family ATPase [Myxococcota bacterium]
MATTDLVRQRASNIWDAFLRKAPPVATAARLDPDPKLSFAEIGGLEAAKEEVLTYACAVTDPEVYARWGTFPPPALLLVGPASCGKTLLAEGLSTHTGMPFLEITVPRLVLQVLHAPQLVGELLEGWGATLDEMPPTTVFFEELEFMQSGALGGRRPDLPIGPVMEFLLELVDRAIAAEGTLVVGSTSQPDAIRPALLATGRFERVVEVIPLVPDDIAAALRVHAAAAEKRAGRPLFKDVDWTEVARQHKAGSIGEWIRLLHAVLRARARCEAANEPSDCVITEDLITEVERAKRVTNHLPPPSGRYL